MGKSYVENSLKRFLKRKVKITLGLVVTFLITGAFVFAGEEQKEIETAKKYLTGLGTEINLNKEITAGKVKISSDNGEIKITFADNKEVAVSKDIISAETGKVIQNSLNLINGGELFAINDKEYNKGFNLKDNGTVKKVTVTDKNGNSWEEMQVSGAGNVYVNEGTLTNMQVALDGATVVNKGIITTNKNGQKIRKDSVGYNYGIIANKGAKGQLVEEITKDNQVLSEKSKGYNYGIIANAGGWGQYATAGEINNYGIIANNGQEGQTVREGGTANNYGIISNNGIYGQYINNSNITQKKGTLNNYGIIANKGETGQHINYDGTGNNYGIIANDGKNGQYSQNGTINNYGIIANKNGYGQNITGNSNVYNYGIIASGTSTVEKIETNQTMVNGGSGKAENYGMIKATTGYIFDGKVDNYGIVILKDENHQQIGVLKDGLNNHKNGLGEGEQKGVVLTKDFNLLSQEIDNNNDGTIDLIVNKNVTDLSNGGIIDGAENKTYYTLNKTAEFDKNLTNNVLNAVITEKDKTAFKYTGNSALELNNSQIIGYFENDGTLLEVEKDLTLKGNSVINAIAGNKYTGYAGNTLNNVVAVKLADNGTLTLNDNSKVFRSCKRKRNSCVYK